MNFQTIEHLAFWNPGLWELSHYSHHCFPLSIICFKLPWWLLKHGCLFELPDYSIWGLYFLCSSLKIFFLISSGCRLRHLTVRNFRLLFIAGDLAFRSCCQDDNSDSISTTNWWLLLVLTYMLYEQLKSWLKYRIIFRGCQTKLCYREGIYLFQRGHGVLLFSFL